MTVEHELLRVINAACDAAQLQVKTLTPTEATQQILMAGLRFLAEKIDALEANPIEYAGRHYADKSYNKNQMVTNNGRLWICIAGNTREQPGNSEHWDMVANKGRDGRDAR